MEPPVLPTLTLRTDRKLSVFWDTFTRSSRYTAEHSKFKRMSISEHFTGLTRSDATAADKKMELP